MSLVDVDFADREGLSGTWMEWLQLGQRISRPANLSWTECELEHWEQTVRIDNSASLRYRDIDVFTLADDFTDRLFDFIQLSGRDVPFGTNQYLCFTTRL